MNVPSLFFAVHFIEPTYCGRPPGIENGDTRYWTSRWYYHGDTVEYTCNHKYILLGQSHKTCYDGNWIGDIRCFKAVGCGTPPPLDFGDVQSSVKNNYDHGERVEYSCQSHYTLDGQTHKTCSNGQWTGDMRCLRPCTVTLDDMRRNNIGLKYKPDSKIYSPHKDFLEFNCTTGSPDGRLAMRQQCIDGVMLLPSCQ
uniref:Sushi domain-containing protein n=1 Tax=Myripristis murdjan TaxID=586833 RepID=A0A667ZTL9_9TELE